MTLLRSRGVDATGATAEPSVRPLLGWLCAGVVLARVSYVLQPLRSDEGGYLLVARQWHSGGEFLYGDYYVDRPPLLMAIFWVAGLTDWDPAIRLLTIPFALVFLLAAARAGFLVAGRAGARWSAVVAAGLICSPALGADQADGELFAAVLVMVALALTLEAWHATAGARMLRLAIAAGVFAGAAPLVKQNFVDGLLFAAVLVVAEVLRHRQVDPRAVTVVAGGLVGAAMPHLVVWAWAARVGVEPAGIWEDLAGFRAHAFDVIWSGSLHAPLTRAVTLVALGVVSGVFLVAASWLLRAGSLERKLSPEEWAISSTLLFGLVAIAAGGSYWPHYLLQLAPVGALAAGAVAATTTAAGRWMRASGRTVAGSAALGAVVVATVYATVPSVWFQQRAGDWLAASGRPGDTAVVVYGHASVLEAAGMQSPYPHLWSLPMRTLDPTQARLRATLQGPRAPAWVVQMGHLDSWRIDKGARLRGVMERRYRVVAEVCGRRVWLRSDLDRRLAPAPRC